MKIQLNRNVGMILAGAWFLLTGLISVFNIGIPENLMGILALFVGIFILFVSVSVNEN